MNPRHAAPDMSNGSERLNCGGRVIGNIFSGVYANIRPLCIVILKLHHLPETKT